MRQRRWNTHRCLPLLGLALGFTLLTAMGTAQDNSPRLAIGKDARSIAITATDKVTHDADLATVHVGYELFGPDKDAAYAAGSRASNAIIDALHKAGVADKEIESESQAIQPTQYFNDKTTPAEKVAKAFTITQSWTARVPAADASKVLDVAVKAGANQSGQIDWSLADPNAAQSEAAAKALQRARTQASAMANGLGVKLGALLYASNEVNAEPVRPLMRAAAAPMALMEQKVMPLAINARHIETSATVYAIFAIE